MSSHDSRNSIGAFHRRRCWRAALRGLYLGAILALPTLPTFHLHGASPEETIAYNAILAEFKDGIYGVLEKNCGDFLQQFPASDKVPDVVLMQAQARLKMGRFDEALALLTEKASLAGKLADEFAFWSAETRFQKGDLPGAADAFAEVSVKSQSPARRLEASYSEAYARSKLGDDKRAVKLLQDPNGTFQQTAKARPDDVWTVRGWLFLGERLLAVRDYPGAETALNQLANSKLLPELDWQRHFLLAQVHLAQQHWNEALTQATNLWTSATNSVRAELVAEAAMVHGRILERLGRPDEARQLYSRNLGDGTPAAQHGQAVERTIDLYLRQDRPAVISQFLENFIAQHPQDATLDLVRLTLGELNLRQYYQRLTEPGSITSEVRATLTNLLAQARTQFDLVVTNFPNSSRYGSAQLDRGWCLWEEGTNHLSDAVGAFRLAAERLPRTVDQAKARFKLGDCQFRLGDAAAAVTNYWLAATNYAGIAGLPETFVPQALYQIVRAGISANDSANSSAALTRLLAEDPEGKLAAAAELQVGQALSRSGNPLAARDIYADFTQHFPSSPLLPEVSLAKARTYERQGDLAGAVTEYQAWLATWSHQTSVPPATVAQASFDLGQLAYRLKPDTNSVNLLTTFTTRFPDHTNVPRAQLLLGEYFFNQNDTENAELHFQDKSLLQGTNPQTAELAYEARLMAGRAAFAGQRYNNAKKHFLWLIENGPLSNTALPIPVPIVVQAYLFLGDTFISEGAESPTNAVAPFDNAITTLSKITENFPSDENAPIAQGRIGDCLFQIAALDPARALKSYDGAVAAYQKVIDSKAPIETRSHAEIGLGDVLVKRAKLVSAAEAAPLLTQALEHFTNVLYRKNLRGGEQSDPAEVKQAGIEAADLLRSQKRWEEATRIYERLAADFPFLRAWAGHRIDETLNAKERGSAGK